MDDIERLKIYKYLSAHTPSRKSFLMFNGREEYLEKININTVMTPTIFVDWKVPFITLINKEHMEPIARELLNNSKMLSHYSPFEEPLSENDGESDNLGKNKYDIDTKILYLENRCSDAAREGNNFIITPEKDEYMHTFCEAYSEFRANYKPICPLRQNQYKIINKATKTLEKFKDKNILFVNPVPQLDLFYMRSQYFERTPIGSFFWVLSNIMIDTKFKKDLYFSYPLMNNTFHLVKIKTTGFTSESLIKVKKYQEYAKVSSVGFTIKETNEYLPYDYYNNYRWPLINRYKYPNKRIESIKTNDVMYVLSREDQNGKITKFEDIKYTSKK